MAIAMLFAVGIFEHYLGMEGFGMDGVMIGQILDGKLEDLLNLNFLYGGMLVTWYGGVILLWVAAVLTVLSGADYFRKALPHLQG